MDAKGIINYYGMLRILKALEGHGFTQKELKRITAHLELEVRERVILLSVETSSIRRLIFAKLKEESL